MGSIGSSVVLLALPPGWEMGGYAVAGVLGVAAVALIALGTGMAIFRKMMAFAKLMIALGVLTIVVAVATAAALILAF